MSAPRVPPNGAFEPTLNTIKFYIDSAMPDNADFQTRALAAFNSVQTGDWWLALLYAYNRLESINNEIHIFMHCLNEIGLLLDRNLVGAVFNPSTLTRTVSPVEWLSVEFPGAYDVRRLKGLLIHGVVEFGRKKAAMVNAVRVLDQCSREARGKFLL